MKPQKLLIIKLSSLGDILQASPVTPIIKQHFPNCAVHWLVFSSHLTLVTHNPHVDKAIGVRKNIFSLLKCGFTLLMNRYDAVIIMHRSPMLGLICRLLGYRVRIGFTDHRVNRHLTVKIPFDLTKTRRQRYSQLLSPLGIEASSEKPFVPIYVPTKETDFEVKQPCIAIGHGGGKNHESEMETRRWTGFDGLIDHLTKIYSRHHIYILGDEHDADLASEYQSLSLPRVSLVAGSLSMNQTAELLSKADVFIGNDSFLLFLAASQAIPTVGIFGPTHGAFIMPEGKMFTYVQSEVSCSPCYDPIHWKTCKAYNCPYQIRCMTTIDDRRVMSAVEGVLS
ncbi:MAG: glycosyltransferase family 9 protein [Candidatus Margulisbacteria bacterium]|nr:glycosyltransferase family 9 protein [Candidatus Margulisiibacteriota bacterium]